MSLRFSPVTKATMSSHGGNFSVRRLDLGQLGDSVAPIMGFDHFFMSGPTFAPHPHAGFSAVSYVFEDSAGALRNRDSMGHDLVVQPGELVWTQAGSGVIHDEFPARTGATVEGLQLFVNLCGKNKHIAPAVFYGPNSSIPVHTDARGNRVRILSGELDDVKTSLSPIEAFDFFDAKLVEPWTYRLKAGRNAMIYVLKGSVSVLIDNDGLDLGTNAAVGINGDKVGGDVTIEPEGDAQILVLSGEDPREPVAVYGPFIMNTHEEIEQAYNRYRTGEMGRINHR